MQARPLRIAYLCDFSPLDRNMYSGGNSRMYDSLCKHAGNVTILSNSWGFAEPLRRLLHKLPVGINLRLRWRLHLAIARIAQKKVQRELANGQFDILFCAYSLQSLASLSLPYPMVTAFTVDSTNAVFRNSELGSHHGTRFFGQLLDAWVERHERRILNDTNLLFWPSCWIKNSAENRYDLSGLGSFVIPWGANVKDIPPREVPSDFDIGSPVRFLFVGRAWSWKGGALALETVQTLRKRGVDARLTIIGCIPDVDCTDASVEIIGPLDKSVPAELERFQKAFETAHFFLMPSFESYGFAFCEASAYGVPSLCLRTGGVPVKNGINGFALPLEATSHDFADKVMNFLNDPSAYRALCATTRQEYELNLNWDSWGQKVTQILHERVYQLEKCNRID